MTELTAALKVFFFLFLFLCWLTVRVVLIFWSQIFANVQGISRWGHVAAAALSSAAEWFSVLSQVSLPEVRCLSCAHRHENNLVPSVTWISFLILTKKQNKTQRLIICSSHYGFLYLFCVVIFIERSEAIKINTSNVNWCKLENIPALEYPLQQETASDPGGYEHLELRFTITWTMPLSIS